MSQAAVQWLLDGDAAIRWQTLRDLAGASERIVERERRRITRDGWGARLLARQDPEGTWAGGLSSDGGLYSPKWTSTTYTMLLLRDLGLAANNQQARKACRLLLDRGLQRDGGINYGWRGRSETCITGMVLSILSHFRYDDPRLSTIARHLLEGTDVRRWLELPASARRDPLVDEHDDQRARGLAPSRAALRN